MTLRTLPIAVLLLASPAWADPAPSDAPVQPTAAAEPGAVAPTAAPVPVDRRWNDVARYLAGLPLDEGSALSLLAKRPEWRSHQRWFDRTWKAEEQRFLSKVQPWAKEEFGAVQALERPVFYPFSGPDLVTVLALFPNARRYVLFGLEPEGALPEVARIPQARLKDNLAVLETSLKSILSLSFFRTIDMRADFRAAELDGTSPLLLAFLARSGREVLGIEQVRMGEGGEPEVYTGRLKKAPGLVTGVRVRFRAAGGATQEVLYWSVDISDDSLGKLAGFQKHLAALGPCTTYVKSASYLMHKDYFSRIRTLIIEASAFLLQDDSGIPLRFLATGFSVQPYGVYEKPIRMFGKHGQADLKALYQDKARVKPLSFGIGYAWRVGQSNLLSAIKVAPPGMP